jgi:hypothetical protein
VTSLARRREAAYRHALAVGFDRAFLVAAGIALLMVVVALIMVRVRGTGEAEARLRSDIP